VRPPAEGVTNLLWHELTILALESSQEMVSHYLQECGATGVSIEESWTPEKAQDTSFGRWYDRPLNHIRPGYAEIKGYFAFDADMERVVSQMREALERLPEFGYDAGEYEISVRQVDDEEWADAWKAYFKPVSISERLTVKPSWEPYTPREGEIVIELDPGMAFGTGTHPTTALCLRLLERVIRGGETVIDVGTGSGILSIGAAKLGAARVLALDLDPVAVSSASQNVALAGLQDVIEVRQSDLLGILKAPEQAGRDMAAEAGLKVRPPADIVVANILADIILQFTEDVMRVLKPGGIYIASGIYKNKEEAVEAGLREAGFILEDRAREEDWVAFVARKPKGDERSA